MAGGGCCLQHVIGDAELCSQCYEAARLRLVPRRCICGVVFTSRNTVKKAFVACDDDGKHALFALCSNHVRVLEHSVGDDHPIQFYRNLIASI